MGAIQWKIISVRILGHSRRRDPSARNMACSIRFHFPRSRHGLASSSFVGSRGRRSLSSCTNFGILFDIDGVIVRGKRLLPFAPTAFSKLVDRNGRFRVPAVFVTNAGNNLRKHKADQLSQWLNIEIHEDQVVMAHSPLRMLSSFHSKHVLVSGQGPVRDIAANLGFRNVTTMSQLRHAFPALDAVDQRRRRPPAPCAFETFFPRLEAIVLFGEPVRWETSLQLLMDVLTTDGLPCAAPPGGCFPRPHLPVLACNMDLQWMAEAVLPRFGHGAFLVSLENLYKKITGHDMVYTALVGKPSEITYRYSEHVLQTEAQKLGLKKPVRNIYCIGDNICTDIFGANLYDRQLQRQRSRDSKQIMSNYFSSSSSSSRSIDSLMGASSGAAANSSLGGAERCFSVLVETGVYSKASQGSVSLNHSPRDFLPVEESYQEPTYTVRNVLEAVDLIFGREGFS